MKKIFKILMYSFLSLIGLIIVGFSSLYITRLIDKGNNYTLLGEEAPFLSINGIKYRDLNKNGKLDIYEDKNQTINNRIDDLISKMTIEEKAGSMFITMIGVDQDGGLMEAPSFSDPFSFLMESSSKILLVKKMNHFNILAAHPK